MGVAEGIETALSASLLYQLPVWACCNQGLLRQWQPPEGCTHVTIFGDNDSSFVGQAAAYELAWRLARDGKSGLRFRRCQIGISTMSSKMKLQPGDMICRNCGYDIGTFNLPANPYPLS